VVEASCLMVYKKFPPTLYLSEPYSYERDESKKRVLYIKRVGKGKDDFVVDISKVNNYIWEIIHMNAEKWEGMVDDQTMAILSYETAEKRHKAIEEQIQEAIDAEDYELADKLKKKKRKENYNGNS